MIVSNSEVDTFSRCPREWYYSFVLGLQPKGLERKGAIAEGVTGHSFLQFYFESRKAGMDHPEAVLAMIKFAGETLLRYPERSKIINIAVDSATQYLADTEEWYKQYKVIETEKRYIVPLWDGLDLGLTVDIVLQGVKGNLNGEYVVKDFKFVERRYSAAYLDLHVQVPIYMYVLKNFLGLTPLTKGALEFIDRGKYTFLDRKWYIPTKVEHENIWQEFLVKARKLEHYKRRATALLNKEATRNPSNVNCNMCKFSLPCRLERTGADVSTLLATEYNEKVYGYEGIEGLSR